MASLEKAPIPATDPKNPMASTRNFQFVSSQSIAANFGNMIAQSEKKPSKPPKTKTKKRPSEYTTTYPAQIDKPKPFQHAPPSTQQQAYPTHPFPSPARQTPVNSSINSYYIQPNPWQMQRHPPEDIVMIDGGPMHEDSGEEMELSSGSEAESPLGKHQLDRVSDGVPPAPIEMLHTPEVRKLNELDDYMEVSSGPEADHMSNPSSVSPRASTPPFNESAASSHTSAMISNDVRSSIEDFDLATKVLKAPSPGSDLSSRLTPAKSVTPPALRPLNETLRSTPRSRGTKTKRVDISAERPQIAIPGNVPRDTVAQQGMHAAMASRLKPFELHPQEYQLLRDHICHVHVTAYLNIRNRILRLWVRNPLVQVTQEEAIGCVQSSRWTELAKVAYEWLVRKGYINFGCLEIASPADGKTRKGKIKPAKRKTIAIVGAGMAGLGCARQLEGLVRHYQKKWTAAGENPPHVVLLEGRNRIGGRLYSHPLKNQQAKGIPTQKRCTVEMGAHIIVGFDHGNPMNMIVRGQLALHHHMLSTVTKIYDTDGELVNEDRDRMIEALYNDVLERAGQYRHRVPLPSTVHGDGQLIQYGKDPQQKTGPTISQVEIETPNMPGSSHNDDTESVPGGIDKLTGKAYMVTGSKRKKRPAVVAEEIGWHLGEDVLSYDDLNLDAVAKDTMHPTLGAAMDEAVKQYQFLLDLTPQDMRLMNWHYANLEYANAANVGKLSLGGWDQDTGNEFSGGHAQVIGGYQQVPRGLLESPTKLDIRTRRVVKQIEYNIWSGNSKTPGARIQCEDGENIEADYVVLTSSLGVLKDSAIKFSPPLPEWKLGSIKRLGFGLLNKCVLVYDEPFWDVNQDMFGLLREPEIPDSVDQEDYSSRRGRFYFFWNCIKTTGRPVLISLMAGDAAYQAEDTADADLIAEVTQELAKVFKDKAVPLPQETVITRWGQDRFARGTYSYVGPESIPGDYDTMATRVGNLYFAGEATCATHPATVHGAYISGLRAASEIIEDLLGPIEIPKPLVTDPARIRTASEPRALDTPPSRRVSAQIQKPTVPQTAQTEMTAARKAQLEKFEAEIIDVIHSHLGFRPQCPKNPRSNAFLLFTSERWKEVKASMKEKISSKDKEAKVNQVRAEMGHRWNKLSEEEKAPWKAKAETVKRALQMDSLTYDARVRHWDQEAIEIRRQYIKAHPGVMTEQEERDMWTALEQYGEVESGERKAKRASGYADVKDDDLAMLGM